MKKLIALLLPLSFLAFACTSPSTDTEVMEPEQTETETQAEVPAETEGDVVAGTESEVPAETESDIVAGEEEETATVVLANPEQEISMGETELILEVQDSVTGETVPVETLEVIASMPVEGEEEPMISEVEVEPSEEPGKFKVTTNLEMEGDWELVAMVKDAKYKGENKLNLKVN
ncbi:MAG: FixH family protein [Cyanobacteria bacterium P01_G01_bin.49]